MNERDDPAPQEGGRTASDVAERVTALLLAAEEAAAAIRRDAEEQARARQSAADARAASYFEERRREVDAEIAERMARLSEASEGLLRRAEDVVGRLGKAEDVRRQLEAFVAALGESAEQLASELSQPSRAPLTVVAEEQPASAKPPAAPEQPPRPAERPQPDPADEPALSALERLRAASGRHYEEGSADRRGRFAREDAPPPPGDDQMLAARLVALQMAVAGADRAQVEEHLRKEFGIEDSTPILDQVFGRV